MKLMIKRIKKGDNSTLSEVSVNGVFCCYGLEDLVRDRKIKGATAIPAGTYPLRLNTYGAMNARYKRRFSDMHRGMIEISNIPNFSYVYIHIGNNFGDTAGCLLVGDSYREEDGDYILLKSAKAYKRLYAVLVEAVMEGEVEVELRREDGKVY